MKVTAVIPSRYESSRFPGKPLALISGKPMVQMVYERAKSADRINGVVVATDSEKIYRTVKDFGGDVVMTSDQCRSGTDRVAEAAEILGLEGNDVIVNIQGDQPLMHPNCLNDLVKPFLKQPDLEMSTLAFAIVRKDEITNPKDVKVIFDNQFNALYFSRATVPFDRDEKGMVTYYKHLGFYAYSFSFLQEFKSMSEGRLEKIEKLEQLRVLEQGHGIKVVVTNHDSLEVDLPSDIETIEIALTRNQEQ